MKKQSLFISAAVAMVVVFAAGAMMFNASRSAGTGSAATMATLDRAHAATMGPADAPVVIAEFLDPACETCAMFYPAVKSLMDANPGQIRLVIRWAPFHEGSTNIVGLLEAARKQDKFWPALERLLATQSAWAINHSADVELAWRQLGGLGLDLDQITADMAGAELMQIVEQDLADATTLNVTKTPEFFVNGSPLPSFGWEQLQALVSEALAEAGL